MFLGTQLGTEVSRDFPWKHWYFRPHVAPA